MAPGLIMMALFPIHSVMSSASFYGLRFQKSIEEILVSPIPEYLILIVFLNRWHLTRNYSRYFSGHRCALLYASAYSTSFYYNFCNIINSHLFSLAGFTNALYARTFDDISIIPTLS